MESELMSEPWPYPQELTSCIGGVPGVVTQHVDNSMSHITTATTSITTTAAAAASVTTPIAMSTTTAAAAMTTAGSAMSNQMAPLWEENFQDLSGWCMANAQARCDFPTGESSLTSKLTGSRYESSGDVITSANGAARGKLQAIGKKMMMTTSNSGDGQMVQGVRRSGLVTHIVQPHIVDHAYPMHARLQQKQQHYFNNNNNNSSNNNNNNNLVNSKANNSNRSNNLKSGGSLWIDLPTKVEPIPTPVSEVNWQELGDLGITAAATGLPVYQQPNKEIIDIDTKQHQQQIQQRDNQDVFPTFEADATNEFDLLSYLCEDDIPSPGDSVSTDSSRITDINNQPRLPPNSSSHIIVSPRTYEPIALSANTMTDSLKSRLQPASDSPYSQESPKHSPLSSTSSEVTLPPTRSSYRQLRTIVKIEKPETPPPMVTSLERRSTRTRRTRANSSTSSRSSNVGGGRGKGRKRLYNDSDESEDDDDDGDGYRETREKNNEASRKSRMNKKAKEMDMAKRAVELEKDNRILKMKVEELEKLVTSMRNALLRSAIKREAKTNMF